jgi:phosphoenolpyruvate carboxykinase (GTP)
MIDRIEGQAKGQDTMFGIAPQYAEINWTGLDFNAQQFQTVTHIDKAAWVEELKLHDAHFEQLSYHLPKELLQTRAAIEKRLAAA